MKRLYFLLAILMCAYTVTSAQQYRTSYFMEGSTMRGYLNPALRPDRGYVYIPVLGGTSFNFGSNALAFNTVYYPKGDNGSLVSLLDRRVSWGELEPHLKNMNDVAVDFRTVLLGAGFYTGRDFWTIELGVEADAGFNVPKSLFEFVKLGANENTYNMSGLGAGADTYANLAVGYSRMINRNLTVGARVNFKGGLARAKVHYDRLDLTLNDDRWAVAAKGGMDISVNGLDVPVDSDGYVDTDKLEDMDLLSHVRGLAGFGMTFDFGAEYILMDRFKLSAAITNLGFMNWNAKDTFVGVSEAAYDFTGMYFEFDPDNNSWVQQGDADFDLEGLAKFKEAGGKSRTRMYPGFTLGAEYDIFGNNLLGAGALLTHRKNEYFGRTEFSLSATVRPADWFTASLSYAVGNYKSIGDNFFNSFGLAVNFHPGWINFFLGTDFLIFNVNPQFIPIGQRQINFTVGLSVPLTRNPYSRYCKK